MLLTIPDVLTREQVSEARKILDAAEWVDGKVTAGHQSSKVKDNMQLPEGSPAAKQLGEMILMALARNPFFISAALPKTVFPPLFNRYTGGQSFGTHVDNAVRQITGTGHRIRTDLSATLFLTAPEEYDGGELCVEDNYGVKSVKLTEGHMVLYPATSLHHVKPVTRGARVCSFFWLQSMIRDDGHRTLLFDLDRTIQQISRDYPSSPYAVQLTGIYHNLLRQWAELSNVQQPKAKQETGNMLTLRNIIFWIHLMVGIIIGIVIFIMASTGMMLAFRAQIIHLTEQGIYKIATPQTLQDRLKIQDLLDRIHDDYPEDKVTGIAINSNPHTPVMIRLGEDRSLYVNPYTGVILGDGSSIRHWFADVEYWHRWLGMKGDLKVLGGGIKRACNVAFFFMILTGLYLWWPRPWTAKTVKPLTQLNIKLKGRARDFNWHNVIGFWAAPFLITISLTGIIMSYPWANNLLYRMTGNQPPAMTQDKDKGAHRHHHDDDADADADDDDQASRPSLDVLFTHAEAQSPDWKTITLRISSRPDAPAVFNIEESGVGHRSQLTLNRTDAGIIKWEPYSSQNSGKKLRTFVRFLHTGEVGGLIGQTIAFLAAGCLVLLIWTGFAKAWRRFFPKGRGAL